MKLAIERLFDAISGTPVEVHNEPLMVRCSMGVGYGMVNDELITEADRALLRAKQVGKDRIGWPDALEAFKSVWSEASVYGFSRAFNHLTRNSAVPCLATDANYVIVDVNPAFEQLSGYSRRELIGNKPSQLAAGNSTAANIRRFGMRWRPTDAGKGSCAINVRTAPSGGKT
ncbi:hypothetical protein GCM10025857_31360 [Alicyclobacillus contaminans]|nr:hypothetical protein GCM10025857_31360 [Alicyclobacillus contaminans]